VYVKDALNDKVQSKRDVQRLTQTPILGEISVNTTGSTLVVKEESGSSVAELFRLVRSNLQFATAGKENKVVLITSSTSGEGKTFFSINLAASLTLIGKKVCLLELDLRKPGLFKQLEMTPGTGISDYLVATDKIAIEDIIKPMENVPGLYVASCGSIPPNPAELMMSDNLAHLIRELRASFDYVIVDTAPVGKVADAFSLSALVDSTLYIVRYDYTTKSQLELIEDIYVNKKFAHPMVILNGVKEGTKHAYGYGYNYGYEKSRKEEISVS
jgi:capsular exopolysaccharide synthesis family protein